MLPYQASWRIVGVVVERRELTSEKNATWRGHVVKLATIGATYEVEVSAEQFKTVGDGAAYDVSGRFDSRAMKTGGSRVVLVVQSIKPIEEKRA